MGRVLIVDDEQNIRDVFKRALVNASHEVMVARNGKMGEQIYEEFNPDSVILDIIVPDQEGIETIMKLKASDSKAKIIAVSGGGMESTNNYLNSTLKLGAKAAFEKPVSLSDLVDKVNLLS